MVLNLVDVAVGYVLLDRDRGWALARRVATERRNADTAGPKLLFRSGNNGDATATISINSQ